MQSYGCSSLMAIVFRVVVHVEQLLVVRIDAGLTAKGDQSPPVAVAKDVRSARHRSPGNPETGSPDKKKTIWELKEVGSKDCFIEGFLGESIVHLVVYLDQGLEKSKRTEGSRDPETMNDSGAYFSISIFSSAFGFTHTLDVSLSLSLCLYGRNFG